MVRGGRRLMSAGRRIVATMVDKIQPTDRVQVGGLGGVGLPCERYNQRQSSDVGFR